MPVLLSKISWDEMFMYILIRYKDRTLRTFLKKTSIYLKIKNGTLYSLRPVCWLCGTSFLTAQCVPGHPINSQTHQLLLPVWCYCRFVALHSLRPLHYVLKQLKLKKLLLQFIVHNSLNYV